MNRSILTRRLYSTEDRGTSNSLLESFRKTLFWTFGLGVPVYIGATLYAQEDKEFKRYFRDNVIGGDFFLKTYKSITSSSTSVKPSAAPTKGNEDLMNSKAKNSDPSDIIITQSSPKKSTKETEGFSAFTRRITSIMDELKSIDHNRTTSSSYVKEAFSRITESMDQLLNHAEILFKSGQIDSNTVILSKLFVNLVKSQLSAFQQLNEKDLNAIEKLNTEARSGWEAGKEKDIQLAVEEVNLQKEKEFAKLLDDQKGLLEAEQNLLVRRKVDEERGHRLARLELAEYKLKVLEDVVKRVKHSSDIRKDTDKVDFAYESIIHTLECPVRSGFSDQWRVIKNFSEIDSSVKAVVNSLSENVIETGVEGYPILVEKFHRLVPSLRSVAFLNNENGYSLKSHVLSHFFSYFTVMPNGYVNGDGVESILARTEYWIGLGNLDMAAREMNTLTGWPRHLAHEWLEDCRRYLEVQQALGFIKSHIDLLKVTRSHQ